MLPQGLFDYVVKMRDRLYCGIQKIITSIFSYKKKWKRKLNWYMERDVTTPG